MFNKNQIESNSSIVVLGDGPAAVATVLTLLQHGCKICWLLNSRLKKRNFIEHLPPEVAFSLSKLGLRGLLDPNVHQTTSGVKSYWGDTSIHERDYLFGPFGYGWNLDRTRFDQSLINAAIDRGASPIEVSYVSILDRNVNDWRLELTIADSRFLIQTSFLIDATGRNASLARQLRHKPVSIDKLTALYAKITVHKEYETIIDKRLMIESVENGWWYSLVNKENELVAVYMTDMDLLSCGAKDISRFWISKLKESKKTTERIGNSFKFEDISIAPVYGQFLESSGGDGWLAAGDANMALDPLTGLGVLRALQDGVDAAKAAIHFVNGNRKYLDSFIFDKKVALDKYLEQRNLQYQRETRWIKNEFWRRRHEY